MAVIVFVEAGNTGRLIVVTEFVSDEARAIFEKAKRRESFLDNVSKEVSRILEENDIKFEQVFRSTTFDDKLRILIFFSEHMSFSSRYEDRVRGALHQFLIDSVQELRLVSYEVAFESDRIVKEKYGHDYDKWYLEN